MPGVVLWRDVALRLLLAAIAGILIGLNRQEHGRPAGLRTTLLVCLAACLAMIQANVLMVTTGLASATTIRLDLMRLPLGILSGIGFIGAGAIVRRHDLVLGVTTAATLWFVTVVGLCFGGGQLGLGLGGLALGFATLWGLEVVDDRMPRERRATLELVLTSCENADEELRAALESTGFRIASATIVYNQRKDCRELRWDVHWRASARRERDVRFLGLFARRAGVLKLAWIP